MFTISRLLQILFERSKHKDWSDPKKLTEGVTMILEPDSFAHETETFTINSLKEPIRGGHFTKILAK